MSNRLQGGILAGSTSVSLPVVLRKTADNTENTGVAAAGVTYAYYWRQGGTPAALTALSDLASITSVYAAGGWKEADSTHVKGVYRLDVDNAAFATGADWVIVSVTVASCYEFIEKYALTTNVIQSGDAYANEGVAGLGLTAIPTIATVTNVTNQVTANVTQIAGSALAATNQKQAALALYSGTVTGGNTTTTLIDSGLTQTDTNFWNGRVVIFLTGAIPLQATAITGFNSTTHQLTFNTVTTAPNVNDTYAIF